MRKKCKLAAVLKGRGKLHSILGGSNPFSVKLRTWENASDLFIQIAKLGVSWGLTISHQTKQ